MLGEEKMQQPFRHIDHTELGGGFSLILMT
jgi:hypothetical protein